MKAIMRFTSGVFVAAFVAYLYIYTSSHNMGVFNPKGIVALAEKNLIVTTVLLMLIAVIPIFTLLAVFAWRYRASGTSKYHPDWQSNTVLELIWWSVPMIIIGIIASITWTSSHELDPYKPLVSNVPPITIQVVALQWKWLFIYPELNIATVNYIQFPENTPVNFRITADAPMNSFWIPQLGGQIYAMPGMDTKIHLMASQKGDYSGLSSNYSGYGFSGMKFVARASSKEDFDLWVSSVKNSPNVLSMDAYHELEKKSKDNQVASYSSVEQNLYNRIIRKFISPENGTMISGEGMPSMSM